MFRLSLLAPSPADAAALAAEVAAGTLWGRPVTAAECKALVHDDLAGVVLVLSGADYGDWSHPDEWPVLEVRDISRDPRTPLDVLVQALAADVTGTP